MHLNEFADPNIYALPADDMAAVIKHEAALVTTDPSSVGERSSQRTGEGTLWTSGGATGLSGSHVGSIYRPGVRNSAGEFPPSQPTAANPFFKGPTDDCRCLLPIGHPMDRAEWQSSRARLQSSER